MEKHCLKQVSYGNKVLHRKRQPSWMLAVPENSHLHNSRRENPESRQVLHSCTLKCKSEKFWQSSVEAVHKLEEIYLFVRKVLGTKVDRKLKITMSSELTLYFQNIPQNFVNCGTVIICFSFRKSRQCNMRLRNFNACIRE